MKNSDVTQYNFGSNLNATIDRIALFSSLSPQQKQRVLEHSKISSFNEKEGIFIQGDPADSLFFLLSGSAQHYIRTPSGQDVFVKIVNQFATPVGTSTILNQPYYIYTLEALTEVQFLVIDKGTINALRFESHDFAQALLSLAAESLYDLSVKIEQSSTFTASQKLICHLIRSLSAHTSEENINIPFSLEKKQLASLLLMKPETFSRALHQLKELGISFEKEHILIENLLPLQRVACANCSKIVMGAEKDCVGRCLLEARATQFNKP